MNVPDGENSGAASQVRTDIKDQFCPAPESRAQEYKRAFPHLVVFFGKIFLKNVAMKLIS
jgi:hypothetical protein